MKGMPGETLDVLRHLIAESETHRQEQIVHLHDLTEKGESTVQVLKVLGQIEDTLAAMRAREAYLRATEGSQLAETHG